MKTFAGFKTETWCMDLAFVDKLAKTNNGAKFLLSRQDLIDQTVSSKRIKAKDSKETVRAFSSTIAKKKRSKKSWVDKGTDFAESLKKFCIGQGLKYFSTMSETKAVFAEGTI